MADNVDFSKPLMPKATAMWLIENTALTFRQIARFCSLHEAEVEALANEDVGRAIRGANPVHEGLINSADIERCEKDPAADLKIIKRTDLPGIAVRAKGPRYTSVSKRGDKPDAIAYLLKQHPELKDSQICKLVGTTKPTIQSVRDRTHPNSSNMRPRNPAELGLCTYQELERLSHKALRALGRDPEAEAQKRLAQQQQDLAVDTNTSSSSSGGFDFSNFLKSSQQG